MNNNKISTVILESSLTKFTCKWRLIYKDDNVRHIVHATKAVGCGNNEETQLMNMRDYVHVCWLGLLVDLVMIWEQTISRKLNQCVNQIWTLEELYKLNMEGEKRNKHKMNGKKLASLPEYRNSHILWHKEGWDWWPHSLVGCRSLTSS